jgi:hypothetical protein
LKLAGRLDTAGFTRTQADDAAEALADSLSHDMATESDIADLRVATRRDIAELHALISTQDGRLSTLIGAQDSRLSTQISALDRKLSTEIASVRSATAQWIITAVFIYTAGLIGARATVWQRAPR